MRKLLLLLIQAYRYLISPLIPSRCRYLPTCSEYAWQAISRHGTWKGGALALRRLGRCHPWGQSGYDPVPESCCTAGRATRAPDADSDSSSRQTVQ